MTQPDEIVDLEELIARQCRREPEDVRQLRYHEERRSWAAEIGRPCPDERPRAGLVRSTRSET